MNDVMENKELKKIKLIMQDSQRVERLATNYKNEVATLQKLNEKMTKTIDSQNGIIRDKDAIIERLRHQIEKATNKELEAKKAEALSKEMDKLSKQIDGHVRDQYENEIGSLKKVLVQNENTIAHQKSVIEENQVKIKGYQEQIKSLIGDQKKGDEIKKSIHKMYATLADQ